VETVFTWNTWQLFSSLLSQLIIHLLLSFSLSYFSLPKDALTAIPAACHTHRHLASSSLTLLVRPPILFPSLSFWTKSQVHISSPSSNRRPSPPPPPPWYLYGRRCRRNHYPYEMSLDYLLVKSLNHPHFSTALAKILGYFTRVCSKFHLSLTLHFLDSDSDVFFICWQRPI
jgi:hypothetical protein